MTAINLLLSMRRFVSYTGQNSFVFRLKSKFCISDFQRLLVWQIEAESSTPFKISVMETLAKYISLQRFITVGQQVINEKTTIVKLISDTDIIIALSSMIS